LKACQYGVEATPVKSAAAALRTVLREVVPYSVGEGLEQVFLRGCKLRAKFVETV
jgi:hypothetical protein